MTARIRRMIHFAFVYPHLLYGIEVYYVNANATTNHLTSLRTLNNKLLRILQQKPTRTHTAELYRTYHTLPTQLLHYEMHKYVGLYRRFRSPPAYSEYVDANSFDENKLIHIHNTR